jgi:hypothetical protein
MWLEALRYVNIVIFKISYFFSFQVTFILKRLWNFMWLQLFIYQFQDIYMDTIVVFSQLSIFNFQQIMQLLM